MHQVMCGGKVRSEQVRYDEPTNANQNKHDTQDLANHFCHDLSVPPVKTVFTTGNRETEVTAVSYERRGSWKTGDCTPTIWAMTGCSGSRIWINRVT